MLTETPQFILTQPMFISSRLIPAVKIDNATLSAQCHAIEADGRTHWQFFLDIPTMPEWVSEESYVTALGATWTQSVAMALETFCDVAGTDDLADNHVAQGITSREVHRWLVDNTIDFMGMAETLREWIEANH